MKDFNFYTNIDGEKRLIYWIYLRDAEGNLIKRNLYNPKNRTKFKSRLELMKRCGSRVKINGEKTPEVCPNNIFVEVSVDYAIPLLVIGGILGYVWGGFIGCAIGGISLSITGLYINYKNNEIGKKWNSELIPEEELHKTLEKLTLT